MPPMTSFMRISLLVLSFSLLALGEEGNPAQPPPKEDLELIEVVTLIPNIVVDLPYATENNFFKRRFYGENRCFLRRGVVGKLALVQRDLNAQGLGLKLWDGYRPRSVQWEFWKVLPDPKYVADPKQGSRHNRGAAVDCTLVDLKTGKDVLMPTAHDDFTPKAAAAFKLVPAEALKNRQTLQDAMTRHGFQIFESEWWHFDAPGWKGYALEDFDPWEAGK